MKMQSLVLAVLLSLNAAAAVAQSDIPPPPPPPELDSLPPPPPPEIAPADSIIFDNVSRGYDHFEPIQESHDFGPELDNDRGEVEILTLDQIPQDMIDAAENPTGVPDRDE